METPHPTADPAIARIARKYRALVALREAHARGEGVAARPTLRALAAEFPSALREIDRLPMDLLRARARGTEAAARDPARVEPWMEWMAAWHALMAATLATRRALPRGARPPEERVARLAEAATERAGLRVDEAYVARVASPPGGRLSNLVLERLGEHFGVAPATLREGLFPTTHRAGRV